MVLHLGRQLVVPPRELNIMLTSAGFASVHTETPLASMEAVSAVIDTMLDAHMPNPALVVDRQWNLLRFNGAAGLLTAMLFPTPPEWIEPPLNVMRLSFHPEGMRPHMVDWEHTAAALLRRLERDASSQPHDTALQELLDEVLAYPDVASLRSIRPRPNDSDLLVSATYVLDEQPISFFTTIARIGDAHDLTLAELRLETFWPLDPGSRAHWLRLTTQ